MNMPRSFVPADLLWLIPAGMLVAALLPWPYAYYRLLRFVVFVCCGVIIYKSYEQRGPTLWLAGLAIVAVVFNPIVPFRLARFTWSMLNLASAAYLIAHMWFEQRRTSGDRL